MMVNPLSETMTAPSHYGSANLLSSMVDAVNAGPVGSPSFDKAVKCVYTIANDWNAKIAAGQVAPDGGTATAVLQWVASLPCPPEMAEEKMVTMLETIWKAKNAAEMRDFIDKHQDMLSAISKKAVNPTEMIAIGENALPASVRRIGALLRQCAETGPAYSQVAALLLPQIPRILRCYLQQCMRIAIDRNGVAFVQITFSIMHKVFSANRSVRDEMLQELKTWVNDARKIGNENMEKMIDNFRETLVKQVYTEQAVQDAGKGKRKIQERDEDDDETEDEIEAPASQKPSTPNTSTIDFLTATYAKSNKPDCWISRKDILAAIREWGKPIGRTFRFTSSIGRDIYIAFPKVATKKEGGLLFFNLEAK